MKVETCTALPAPPRRPRLRNRSPAFWPWFPLPGAGGEWGGNTEPAEARGSASRCPRGNRLLCRKSPVAETEKAAGKEAVGFGLGRGGSTDGASAPPARTAPERLVIKHARLHAYVDDVGAAWAAIRKLCAACGGEVATGERRKSGSGDRGEMLIRFPAGRFEEAMAAAEGVGEVRGLLVEADDVTAEYADLRGRAAGVAPGRPTEESEQLARQRDYLADRASVATLWLELEARAEYPSRPEVTWREVVGASFRGAVSSLAEAMARWSEANPALPPLPPGRPSGWEALSAPADRLGRG